MSTLIFTVDLEDWYHGIPISVESWAERERRLEIGANRLLKALQDSQQTATFFVLGDAAEKHPQLIKTIASQGHEIACHGQNHQLVYEQSQRQFKEDVSKSKKLLENLVQQPVKGYRAPYFSVTDQSLWALDILKELGFEYDSSVSPVKTWRYGITGAPSVPYRDKKTGMIEIPVSSVNAYSKQFNFGGAYFRILPYSVFPKFLNQQKQGEPSIFYIHPWEYDPKHPFTKFKWKAMITHYWNLSSTYKRTCKLLDQQTTLTMNEYANQLRSGTQQLEQVSLGAGEQ